MRDASPPLPLRESAEALAAALPPLLARAEALAATVVLGEHGRRRAGTGDEFWGDMTDETLCEELGGPGPEEGWWPFILERWDERVAARQPYAKRARADAQRLRAICDRVERQRHVLAYEAPSLGDDRESGGRATGG